MSSKVMSFGPYSGMSLEEVVSADPWFVRDTFLAGGNHGISEGLFNRATRMIEEQEADPYDAYEELLVDEALALEHGLPLYGSWEERYD